MDSHASSADSAASKVSKEEDNIVHTHSHTHSYHHHTIGGAGVASHDATLSDTLGGTSHLGAAAVGPSPNTRDQSFADSALLRDSLANLSTASASSHRSVRDALAELNLKMRLLEDERDYYVGLHDATDKAYAHHRQELQSLLLKERALFATSMRAMEGRLQTLRDEVHAAGRLHTDAHESMMKDMLRRQEEERADREAKSGHLRSELAEHRTTLELMRSQTHTMLGEKEGLEEEIGELLKRQEMLRSELIKRRAEHRALVEAENGVKPFIPGGKTRRGEYVPASHNVNALVSTIHKRNYMLPNDNRRMRSPSVGGGAVDDASGAILRELMDLRLEYHLLARELNNPHADVTATSARLREILQTVERKKGELRELSKTKKVAADADKLHKMLSQIAKQNNMAEQLFSDLITCIRNPY